MYTMQVYKKTKKDFTVLMGRLPYFMVSKLSNVKSIGNRLSLLTRTVSTRTDVVRRYQASVGNVSLSKDSICSHLVRLRDSGYAFRTLNLDFQILFKGYIDKAKDPIEKMQRQAEREEARRIFVVSEKVQYSDKSICADEIQALISGADPRMSVIIQTLAETGLRVSELCGMTLKNIQREKSTKSEICVEVLGKGRKTRIIFLDASLVERIRTTFDGKRYLFETVHGMPFSRNYIANRVSELSGKLIKKHIHPHTLRHSWITLEIKAGTPIDAVSNAAGHASKAFTVNRYSHNTMEAGMKKIRFAGFSDGR
jgi:integrase